jgi:hypothetical protein
MELRELAETVSLARRKGMFRQRQVFAPYANTSASELQQMQVDLGRELPNAFNEWLLTLGFGDINEELSFRREWVAPIERGQLEGAVRFAQDIEGNFYAFDDRGRVYFLSRSEPVFALVAEDFPHFVEELVRRNYDLMEWIRSLSTEKYDW